MNRFSTVLLSFLFIFVSWGCYAQEANTGTIIVTYQTEQNNTHNLDRVRFWLINEKQERSLYPKKDEYVSNHHKRNERTVVISQLPQGNYSIEFIVPNGQNSYEKILPRIVELPASGVVRVNQVIKEAHTAEVSETYIQNSLTPLPPPISVARPHGGIITTYPNPILEPQRGYLSLNTNKMASWKLMNNGREVYTSRGSISNLPVRPAPNFYILAEEIPGYTLKITPQNPFDVHPDRPVNIELYYQRDAGFIDLEGILSSPVDSLAITLYPQQDNKTPLQANLISVNGKVSWSSGPIGTGEYIISYTLPEGYTPVPNQFFLVEKGQHTVLIPKFTSKGSLQVTANTPQATFTLQKSDGTVVEQGHGVNYTFRSLDPGYYEVIFSSTDPQLYVPPLPQKNFIPQGQNAKITASYTMLGSLIINSNVDKFKVTVQSLDSQREPVEIEVSNRSRKIYLPEGKYRLSSEKTTDEKTLKPVDVTVRTTSPQNVYLSFEKPPAPIPPKAAEKTPVKEVQQPVEPLLEVVAGPAIVGDPFTDGMQNERPAKTIDIPTFSISAYEVTNVQYSKWLNDAFRRGIVKLDPKYPGRVNAENGTLLIRTSEANPLAQISISQSSSGTIFIPAPGKGPYPVIEVTWYGADLFCRDQGLRLPSESQWEKAAGTTLTKENTVKRYKFGFSQDIIDRTWANYKDSTKPITAVQVLTTPVGFYNGKNSLPLLISDQAQVFTHDGKSPAGAYDMSGNVWEWTDSWDELDDTDTHKIAKGGCYDSLADGVRVSERIPLLPGYADVFTGFRAAKYE